MFAFVFYTGADGRAWNVPTDLMDMCGLDPEMRRICEPYVAPGRYHLVNIAAMDSKELVESSLNSEMAATWVLTRLARKADVDERLHLLFDRLVDIGRSPNAATIYGSIIEFLFRNYDGVEGIVAAMMAQVGTVAKEATVTTAERIEERGRLEGEQRGRIEGEARGRLEGEARGRLEGERQALLCLLDARFDSVPAYAVAKVNGADSDQLGVWTRRAAKANRISEVFEA